MKKLLLITACLIAVVTINAQSLEEIIKNYTSANKLDKLSGIETVKITANTSMMGMEMPMELWMKKPNKIKSVMNIMGQEMIQVFDGEKGFVINPMMGSTEPVEMTPEQVKDIQRSHVLQNYIANYYKDGKLVLEGEEAVNGNPAFRIKATLDNGGTATIFIDKSTYLITKTTTEITQGGMPIKLEATPSDYKDNDGIILPMKTTTIMEGMGEMISTFSKVEVNTHIEDSVFKTK